jgi:spherulation-specific family 4 protein
MMHINPPGSSTSTNTAKISTFLPASMPIQTNDQIMSKKYYYGKGKRNIRSSFTRLFPIIALMVPLLSLQGFIVIQAYGQQSDAAGANDSQTTSDSFVLYYGIVDSSSLVKLIQTHPSFAILNTTDGQSNDAIAELHKNGIKVMGALGIDYNKVSQEKAISDIDNYIGKYKVDGVFIDQVNPSADSYLSRLHDEIKSYGKDKTVICNPGMTYIKENLMKYCDILSFEHEWRNASSLDWFNNYAASRYMGFNSIAGAVVGGAVGDPQKNLADAHSMGIQYQYTAENFFTLPGWLYLYGNGETSGPQNTEANTTTTTNVTMKFSTADSAASAFVTVKEYATNRTLYAGITPATVTIPVNETIEAIWLNPTVSDNNMTYADSSVTGGIKTFDLPLGSPIWGGMERFHVLLDNSDNSAASNFKDVARFVSSGSSGGSSNGSSDTRGIVIPLS